MATPAPPAAPSVPVTPAAPTTQTQNLSPQQMLEAAWTAAPVGGGGPIQPPLSTPSASPASPAPATVPEPGIAGPAATAADPLAEFDFDADQPASAAPAGAEGEVVK